jgi:quercetin dioxygenase-like cupin family protein
MKPLALVLFVALLHVAGYSSAQQKVDRKGVTSKVAFETPVSGYLKDVNGKYKLIVTETTVEPGGYVGDHHHAGPGIRYVAAGEWTFVGEGKTITYKKGDYFYESGDITNSASNKGSSPAVLITFEILPVDWKGGSVIPPKK